MKLSKNCNDINLDGMFRLILLIYGEKNTKNVSNFMQDNIRDSMIVNLTKNIFLQQVQKIELIN